MDPEPGEVTELLAAVDAGQPGAHERLLRLVYRQLRQVAAARMAREASGHTLTPTALVHEAWLRLAGSDLPVFRNRRHFLGVAAIAMRRVLIEHARAGLRDKRGGGAEVVTLLIDQAGTGTDPGVLIELDDALQRLALLDAQMARVVELRYFAGLDIVATAEVLAVSPRTVTRSWTAARAWLGRELGVA